MPCIALGVDSPGLPLNAKRMLWLPLAASLLLPSCTTGRLTRLHQDCGVAPFTWSSLKEPPGNADALISAENIGPPRKYESQHWFAASDDRFLLCRVDSSVERGCGISVWIFKNAGGQWSGEPGPITICAD